ncbi:MAG TPA: hypothetical protein VGF39_09585 [Stellaceae bacterium]|jgi:hypothetical protein
MPAPDRPTPPPNRGFLNELFPVDPREVVGGLYSLGTQGVGNAVGWGAGKLGVPSPDLLGRDVTAILDQPVSGGLPHPSPELLAAAPLAIGARRLKTGGKAAKEDASVASTLAARAEPPAAPGAGTGVPNLPTPHSVGDTPSPPTSETGFTAYHGSPHTFDQFDINKIGTGEGAQAYGHGLYFADAEDTAKSYRPRGITYEGQPVSQNWQNSALEFLDPKIYQQQGAQAAIAEAKTRMADMAGFYRKTNLDQGPNLYDNALKRLNEVDPSKIGQTGSMYQVGINADPTRFLDWEKPFAGQHPDVQQAINNLWTDKGGSLEGRTNPPFVASSSGDNGEAIHAAIATTYGSAGDADPQAAASAALASKGIPGIKYLDQGSRDAGTGTSNYVLFGDQGIDILKRYGLIPIAGAPLAYPLSPIDTAQPTPPAGPADQPTPQPIAGTPDYDAFWRRLQAQQGRLTD